MRKIAIVTGTRAEYGLLYWIIKGVHEDSDLELQLIVTGMHLSPEFGLTVGEIEKDGFPIAERVEMLLSSDTEKGLALSMGLGMIGFSNAYDRLRPDIIVVLGDRFEIFSAVAAAVPFRILIAHIHGGEITEGAMDELFRHAITKMSHFHFPATKEYAERIIQMGEMPERVFCCGAPGLDSINKLNLLNKKELAQEIGVHPDTPWGVVTYHPVTLEKGETQNQIRELLNALENFPDIYWILTLPNADTESKIIIESIKWHVKKNLKKSKYFISLGHLRYLSLLKNVVVMVGNSSSGIIEAPSFSLPVVNIGSRQKGRIKAENVIDVLESKTENISNAIDKAISTGFRCLIKNVENPYGNGNSSSKIIEVIKTLPLNGKVKKIYYG